MSNEHGYAQTTVRRHSDGRISVVYGDNNGAHFHKQFPAAMTAAAMAEALHRLGLIFGAFRNEA